MADRFNALSQEVFKKDLSQITIDEIDNAVNQHPYFAPLQFLKLIKSGIGSEAYNVQYQKAILYYPDPLHFERFIHPQEDVIIIEPVREKNEFENKEEVVETLEETLDSEHPDNTEQNFKPAIFRPAFPATTSNEKPEDELVFEPYHTVDYFASQGIKISNDNTAQDKFGKQVKSFTDWLKTMKKLPLAGLEAIVTTAVEKGVENLAEHSVEDAEVVTESMAEVWLKQGNSEKATAVYHKLSLQNPSKSAYFAAKINNINHSI